MVLAILFLGLQHLRSSASMIVWNFYYNNKCINNLALREITCSSIHNLTSHSNSVNHQSVFVIYLHLLINASFRPSVGLFSANFVPSPFNHYLSFRIYFVGITSRKLQRILPFFPQYLSIINRPANPFQKFFSEIPK